MRVLVACEFSGIVRETFRSQGHDAWSCDLLEAEDTSPYHYKGDVLPILRGLGTSPGWRQGWDLMIAHPPCTHLAVSGARWFKDKRTEQNAAIWFFLELMATQHISKIAVENPISIMSTEFRKPDQIIQPWQYGHGETKATCLWLKNLPKLTPTNVVEGREARIHKMPPGPNRAKERSRTYQGIADAMAEHGGVYERHYVPTLRKISSALHQVS